jgi:hypothetical protein
LYWEEKMGQEQSSLEKRKPRILLDDKHGEDLLTYDKLAKLLSERCQVTKPSKKPLELESLIANDALVLISPIKPWQESEISAVKEYVENYGGTLLVLTYAYRKPKNINKLLDPYGLSVVETIVNEKYFDKEDLQAFDFLEDVESLEAGTVLWAPNTLVATSGEAEIVLRFKSLALGAKRALGKGIVYLFSCLTVFGKRQLGQSGNQKFLGNLLQCSLTSANIVVAKPPTPESEKPPTLESKKPPTSESKKSLAPESAETPAPEPKVTSSWDGKMAQEQAGVEKRKLNILLDDKHGEALFDYDELVRFLSERCQVTEPIKKPLELKSLIANDAFILISPTKPWQASEISAVKEYVENYGGTLLVLTYANRKPQNINRLLEPYGLSIDDETRVPEKYFDVKDLRKDLQASKVLEGIEKLEAGRVWFEPNSVVTASGDAEIVLQFKTIPLGAKRAWDKGTVYLFSCLTVFGNRQLKQPGNKRFLDNLLQCLAGLYDMLGAEPTAPEPAEPVAPEPAETPVPEPKVPSYYEQIEFECLLLRSDATIEDDRQQLAQSPFQEIWKFEGTGSIVSCPVVADGLVLVVGKGGSSLYAIDAASGELRWNYAARKPMRFSAAVGGGMVYACFQDKVVCGFDAQTGDVKWEFRSKKKLSTAPAFGEGVVCVGSEDKNLYGLDAASGECRWQVSLEKRPKGTPLITMGHVYIDDIAGFLEPQGRLYAINIHNGELLWKQQKVCDHVFLVSEGVGVSILEHSILKRVCCEIDLMTGQVGPVLAKFGIYSHATEIVGAGANLVFLFDEENKTIYALERGHSGVVWEAYVGALRYDFVFGKWPDEECTQPAMLEDFLFIGNKHGKRCYGIYTEPAKFLKRWAIQLEHSVSYTSSGEGLLLVIDKKGNIHAFGKSPEISPMTALAPSDKAHPMPVLRAIVFSKAVDFPQMCCLCCGQAGVSRATKTRTWGFTNIPIMTTTKMAVPYCQDCSEKVKSKLAGKRESQAITLEVMDTGGYSAWAKAREFKESPFFSGEKLHKFPRELGFRNERYWAEFMIQNRFK